MERDRHGYLLFDERDLPLVDEVVERLGEYGLSFGFPATDGGDVALPVLAFFGSGPASDEEHERRAAVFGPAPTLVVLLPQPAWVPRSDPAETFDFRAGVDGETLARLAAAVLRSPVLVTETVGRAVAPLTGPVAAAALARGVCEQAPEIAGGLGSSLRPQDAPGAAAHEARDWLVEVRTLFDASLMPRLGGGMVVLGLAARESSLGSYLESAGALEPLRAELVERYGPEALRLLDGSAGHPPGGGGDDAADDVVPTHTDNPATVDALQREGIARLIAGRIRAMRALEDQRAKRERDPETPAGRAFLFHLDGPWGSGKTSLLNFVRDELRKEDFVGRDPDERAYGPWVVVYFNAWQHQRIVPPWWWLMTAVQRRGLQELDGIDRARAIRLRLWLLRRRAAAARGWIALALLAAAAMIALFVALRRGLLSDLDDAQKLFAIATSAAALLGTAGAASRRSAQSIVSTSGRGAREYIEQTRDPMQAAKRHFSSLVERLHYPVAILVDDIDRCKGPSVVELLEGIQTLFRDVPVAYLVAADRAWLSDSFATEYRSFRSIAAEPGRPFGLQFLEKTFQMAARVPSPTAANLDAFWLGLIRRGGAADPERLDVARREADVVFRRLESESEVREEIVRNPGSTPEERQARLEAAAIQLAAPRIEQQTEHALRPFLPLFGSNPRGLKRLVNAYGVARDLEILADRNVTVDAAAQQRTALWTILELRWPELADYLAAHPDAIALIGSLAPADAPRRLRPLFDDPRVVDVVEGRAADVHARLDPDTLREILGLPPAVS